ncbi:MAG TPA: response regulator transcription factor [Gemmatimonadaceae bacterium]|nr:response regulator transcription factor [Gemmatimonadaceae bacterium]
MSTPAPRSPAILVVEDDADLQSVLRRILETEGYKVLRAEDGESGIAAALDYRPALVILDVGLPRKDGREVARELRASGFDAPVLMLTARSSVGDKVTGLDAGADDYLPKPFEHAELIARVRALMRRGQMSAAGAKLRVRDVVLDPVTRRVERGGREIALTQKEYLLLEYLMRNAGQTVTREMIGKNVWKQELDPLTNVVDVYINYLRKKLDEKKSSPIIKTVRGAGYTVSE